MIQVETASPTCRNNEILSKLMETALIPHQEINVQILPGAIVSFFDHEHVLSGTVYNKIGPHITVIDEQGFFHICTEYMVCPDTKEPLLKTIIPGATKKKYGYCSKTQNREVIRAKLMGKLSPM